MQQRAGFTLIEIMLVILIIGLLVGSVELVIGDRSADDSLQQEGERLAATINLAADAALLEMTELGLSVNQDSYGYYRFDAQSGWLAVSQQRALQNYRLPPGMMLEVELEGFVWPQLADREERDALFSASEDEDDSSERNEASATNADQERENNRRVPQILFLGGGEITPFVLTLQLDGHERQLQLRCDGQLPVRFEWLPQ